MLPAIYLSVISDTNYIEEFELLYKRYHLVLLDDAYRIIKDYDYAQDIVQETYLRIAKNIDKIDFGDEPLPLLRTVTRNCAINMWAKLKKDNGVLDYEDSSCVADGKNFVDELENKSDAEMIADYVEKMPEGYAEVFVLRYVHDLSCVQIAGLLDTKAATVRKRLQRIREAVAMNLYRGDNKAHERRCTD